MNQGVAAITVNWLTARRTLGAVESIRKYCPDLFVYIADDYSDPKDKNNFMGVYRAPHYRAEEVYDFDNSKLMNIPNTKFIQSPSHRRHGESIDYALPQINEKWILHLDSDARIIAPGVIEYMMEGIDDKVCGIGLEKKQHPDYPKVFNAIMLFRNDLLKQYHLEMKPIYELGIETNSRYFKFLTDNGYKIKYLGSGIRDYFIHLRYEEEKKDEWNRYF